VLDQAPHAEADVEGRPVPLDGAADELVRKDSIVDFRDSVDVLRDAALAPPHGRARVPFHPRLYVPARPALQARGFRYFLRRRREIPYPPAGSPSPAPPVERYLLLRTQARRVKKRILVIDDETMLLGALKAVLEAVDCEVSICSDAAAGLEEALTGTHDLVLVDVRMARTNGAEITEALLARRPAQKVVVITGYPDDPLAARALKAGATGLLRKPFEIARVLDFLGG